jgi:Predicted permeases
MSNFVLIFACLILGVLFKRTGKFPTSTAQVLNSFVIYVSLPALILLQIPSLLKSTSLSAEMLLPISMPWILFGVSYFVFSFLGRRMRWHNAEIGALILCAGLGNTSFVGFPLLETLLGRDSLRVGVLIDQLGTFLVLSTLGIAVAAGLTSQGGRRRSAADTAKSVLTFPPFAALLVAVVWYFTGLSEFSVLNTVFEKLSVTLVPLALIAVGFQLHVSRNVIARQWKPLVAGLGVKMLAAPLLFFVLYVVILGSHSSSTHIAILESAMAPMITASVVAIEFGLNAEIANLMVGVGIPLSLLTIPLLHQILAPMMSL